MTVYRRWYRFHTWIVIKLYGDKACKNELGGLILGKDELKVMLKTLETPE